jgi:hypothetical protein
MLMFQGLPSLPCWRVATLMYLAWKIASLSNLPRTAYCLPPLPAASHHYLPPPTTTGCLTRLPAASHDYLLPTPSPSLRLLREGLRYLALDCFYGMVTAQKARCTRTWWLHKSMVTSACIPLLLVRRDRKGHRRKGRCVWGSSTALWVNFESAMKRSDRATPAVYNCSRRDHTSSPSTASEVIDPT